MATKGPVFGVYLTRNDVEAALAEMKNAGFAIADVSVLLPPEDPEPKTPVVAEKDTKAPEAATAGAGSGAVVGGTLGWLVGAGALVIPGIGPFIAAGPLVATLAGIGVGGALGGFAGVLVGIGIPEHEAKRYEARMTKGGILLVIHCDTPEKVQRASNILQITGAEDVWASDQGAADVKGNVA
jgi:hypothetical protein